MYFTAAKTLTKNAWQNRKRRLKYGYVHSAHPPSGLTSENCCLSAPTAARPWRDRGNTQAVRSDGWPHCLLGVRVSDIAGNGPPCTMAWLTSTPMGQNASRLAFQRGQQLPRGIQIDIIHLQRNRELAFQLSRNRQLALWVTCMKAI